VTLVALTGWGAPEDRRRSREAGFDQHLLKPAVPEQVHALIDHCGAPRQTTSGWCFPFVKKHRISGFFP
jgi:CheY-like chemotaxis protein